MDRYQPRVQDEALVNMVRSLGSLHDVYDDAALPVKRSVIEPHWGSAAKGASSSSGTTMIQIAGRGWKTQPPGTKIRHVRGERVRHRPADHRRAITSLLGANAFLVLSLLLSACGGRATAAAQLKALEATAQKAAKVRFKATYTFTGRRSTSTFSLEQMPPDQLFKSSTVELVYKDKTTWFCRLGSGITCTPSDIVGFNEVAETMPAYTPGIYQSVLGSFARLEISGTSGYHVSFSGATFAGQPSQCVSWDQKSSRLKYCLSDEGVLTYEGTAGSSPRSSSSFRLSSFSTKVSASDFSLPKKAKFPIVP